jgi:hypothetical protein
MLATAVVLLSVIARPHVTHLIQDKLRSLRWKVLEHPQCSMHVSPCDFHVFDQLKKWLNDRSFRSDEDMEAALMY